MSLPNSESDMLSTIPESKAQPPIPENRKPSEYYDTKCPFDGCMRWCKGQSGLRQHIDRSHKLKELPQVCPSCIDRLYSELFFRNLSMDLILKNSFEVRVANPRGKRIILNRTVRMNGQLIILQPCSG